MPFKLRSDYKPQGDQPRAIAELAAGIKRGDRHQALLGVTGSGKTFTVANVVAQVQKPTLVIAHNKTLAGQLFGEFKELFPENAVEFFVSYYDYYQPEAYVPSTDTYIEKDSTINDEIDRLRHSATHSLLTRNDVLIVASVSCIYGLGTAEAYYELKVALQTGEEYPRHKLLRDLVEIQYERNDHDFSRGTFRVKGDTIEIFPAYERSEEHTSELQSQSNLVCRLLLEKKKTLEQQIPSPQPFDHSVGKDPGVYHDPYQNRHASSTVDYVIQNLPDEIHTRRADKSLTWY